jgi:hypothetical protein
MYEIDLNEYIPLNLLFYYIVLIRNMIGIDYQKKKKKKRENYFHNATLMVTLNN